MTRRVGYCTGCHRDGVEVEPRRSHGERVLCDRCTERPHVISSAGLHTDTSGSFEPEVSPKKRKGSLLRSAPPGPEADGRELKEWLTVALGLERDPLESATRYGRHDDSRLVLVLRSGARLVFDRQADAFKAENLRRRVATVTGFQVPAHYGQADAEAIAAVIVRAAETAEEDDDRHEAAEWAHTFLMGAERQTITVAETNTAAGRYEAVVSLARWRPNDERSQLLPVADRSPLVLVEATGERWARTSDVAAHVRAAAGRALSWSSLHGRLIEIGWEHRGQVEQRQPAGQDRAKVHIYVIPGDWEDTP